MLLVLFFWKKECLPFFVFLTKESSSKRTLLKINETENTNWNGLLTLISCIANCFLASVSHVDFGKKRLLFSLTFFFNSSSVFSPKEIFGTDLHNPFFSSLLVTQKRRVFFLFLRPKSDLLMNLLGHFFLSFTLVKRKSSLALFLFQTVAQTVFKRDDLISLLSLSTQLNTVINYTTSSPHSHSRPH